MPAILVAWYPGQRGGNAIADVLFGDHNPSGRLPVTFYRSVEQLPPFADYDMKGRTYRYFTGDALYPFGHGLSYSRFEYADLKIDRKVVESGEPLEVSVSVRNAGSRAGAEVAQLYVRAVGRKVPTAVKQLRGFERVSLAPGERRTVNFRLAPSEDMSRYDVARQAFVTDAGSYEIQLGASSRDIRLVGSVEVKP